MSEPRTIREARIRAREIEAEINALRMSPAMAGLFAPWYLKAAQGKLRQFEREAAKHDDPRLPELKPLDPVVERRPPLPDAERCKRYRCTTCFEELLMRPSELEYIDGQHTRARKRGDGWVRVVCGEWEPVARHAPRRGAR